MSTESAAAGAQAIAAVLVKVIADDLELPPGQRVDPRTLFVDLGLDSAGVVAVAAQIASHLGREVPPELFFDHPTVQDLSRFLAGDESLVEHP